MVCFYPAVRPGWSSAWKAADSSCTKVRTEWPGHRRCVWKWGNFMYIYIYINTIYIYYIYILYIYICNYALQITIVMIFHGETDSDLNRIGSSPFSDKPTCKLTMHKGITREIDICRPKAVSHKTHFEAPPRSESFQGGYRNQLRSAKPPKLSTRVVHAHSQPGANSSPQLFSRFVVTLCCGWNMFSDGSCMFSCCCFCCCCCCCCC